VCVCNAHGISCSNNERCHTTAGKSLVYNAVVFEALVTAPADTTAFYVFPTKALAQDQHRVVKVWRKYGASVARGWYQIAQA
jgi:ATP-dependent helicase YprA (DUF1998 family)